MIPALFRVIWAMLFAGMVTSHSFLRAVAVWATKSAFAHSIVSPTRAETSAGINVSLSTPTRIVSAAPPDVQAKMPSPTRPEIMLTLRHMTTLLQRLSKVLGMLFVTLENLQPGRQQFLQFGIT